MIRSHHSCQQDGYKANPIAVNPSLNLTSRVAVRKALRVKLFDQLTELLIDDASFHF